MQSMALKPEHGVQASMALHLHEGVRGSYTPALLFGSWPVQPARFVIPYSMPRHRLAQDSPQPSCMTHGSGPAVHESRPSISPKVPKGIAAIEISQ